MSEKRTLRSLKGLSVGLFGFAFVRMWDIAIANLYAQCFPASDWLVGDLVHMAKLPAFILIVLLAAKIMPLHKRRLLPELAAASMVASSLAIFLIPPTAPAYLGVMTIFVMVGAAGSALAILQWAELQGCLNPFRLAIYISGAFCLGTLLGWIALGTSGAQLLCLLVLAPIISCATLRSSFIGIPQEDLPEPGKKKVRLPWKIILLFGIYEFAFGFSQEVSQHSTESFTLGMLSVSLALFVAVYFFSHKFDFAQSFRAPFILLACGFLSTFLAVLPGNFLSDLLVSAGYSLIFLLLTMLLCDISHQYRVSAAFLCGIEQLIMYTKVFGHATANALGGAHATSTTIQGVSIALVLLVMLVSLVFVSQKEYSRWLASFSRNKNEVLQVGVSREEAVTHLENHYALSPREKEVFRLMAQEKSAADIENELCIANGTLKSHTRRIYQKMDVHAKSDLLALIKETQENLKS